MVVIELSDNDEMQSQPQHRVSLPPISRPIVVVIDSSDDDEMTATNPEHKNRNAPALPIASSSLIIEVNSDPSTTHLAELPMIIVYDSEEEELIFPDSDTAHVELLTEGDPEAWPYPPQTSSFLNLNFLWLQQPFSLPETPIASTAIFGWTLHFPFRIVPFIVPVWVV